MAHDQIAVGLDGSAAARQALIWAAREARRRGARLVAVTAWPDRSRSRARANGDMAAQRRRLERMQLECLAAATAGITPRPRVGRELIFGDPVVALCHAAGRADLLVVGGDTTGPPRPGSMTAQVAARLEARRQAATTAYGRLVTVAVTRAPAPGNRRSALVAPAPLRRLGRTA